MAAVLSLVFSLLIGFQGFCCTNCTEPLPVTCLLAFLSTPRGAGALKDITVTPKECSTHNTHLGRRELVATWA